MGKSVDSTGLCNRVPLAILSLNEIQTTTLVLRTAFDDSLPRG